MTIFLNGKEKTIYSHELISLIKELELELESLVTILNEKVIPKNEYRSISLKENDKVEILNFVSGG
ncbi:MAG: sulfur carrier protein ThiS [Fusobacteriaceae bacterium]|nr:sulfur carrier protein ThiS [Fusobacteriaceae bacterium]